MGRLKFNDPDGFKTCRKCEVVFAATNEFFHVYNCTYDRLSSRCKLCSNSERSLREKLKLSHNIPRTCKNCKKFFWASLAAINRSKKRRGKFCSHKCWNTYNVGKNSSNRKYDTKDIIKAKILIKQGMRLVDISKEVNIRQNYLSFIKNGKNWSSVVV